MNFFKNIVLTSEEIAPKPLKTIPFQPLCFEEQFHQIWQNIAVKLFLATPVHVFHSSRNCSSLFTPNDPAEGEISR